MKNFTSVALVASFAAAQFAFAEDEKPKAQQKARHNAATAAAAQAHRAEAARRISSQPSFQRKFGTTPQTAINRPQTHKVPYVNSSINQQANVNRTRQVTPRVYTSPNVQNNADISVRGSHNWRGNNGNGNGNVNWSGNGNGNTNWNGNRNGNVNNGNGNANWKNRSGDRRRWSNYQNWDRGRHDRGWWRNNYTRFALFGGGYYYYNSGFWYPAYGYDPYFSTYSYDAPIYAYNDQDPGQVIANVQSQLLRRGYNPGSVDGTYGPRTRNALLNFQSDNGLPQSGEIDEDTLDALGLQ